MDAPKVIGRGKSGIVYYPALNCANPANTPAGENYVTKLVTRVHGEKELENANLIKDKGFDFVIYPIALCEAETPMGNKTHLLFSKYGGTSIMEHFSLFDKRKKPTRSEVNAPYIDKLTAALTALIPKIKMMNDKGIYHNDISFDNIVYNEKEGKAYLIDFELLSTVNNFPGSPGADLPSITSMPDHFKYSE
jgi:serine/threonine protein kinase